MKKISIPNPSQLALLLTAALAQAAWAGSGDAPAQQIPAQAETASPSAETGAAMGGKWFDATTSAGQQAFTPNYEQSGGGLGGGVKTAPARGTPIRTSSGVFIYPGVKVGLGYNDNILGTPTDPASSSLVTLQPGPVGAALAAIQCDHDPGRRVSPMIVRLRINIC